MPGTTSKGTPAAASVQGLGDHDLRLERIARDETDDALSLARQVDERRCGHLDLEDDVGLGQALRRSHRAKGGIARAAADEGDEARAHARELVAYCAGAHVETPAPTMRSGRVATVTSVPSVGLKRLTIVPLPGAVNV